MAIANISAHDMFDVLEGAINGNDVQNGRSDAVAHVGMMITGAKTPEDVSDIHDELFGQEGRVTPEYREGYVTMWKELYAQLF